MLLSEWLTQKQMSRTDFARRIEVSPAHITGLCDGTSWPSRRVANAIKEATAGEVTADDFLGQTIPADPAPQTEAITPGKAAA